MKEKGILIGIHFDAEKWNISDFDVLVLSDPIDVSVTAPLYNTILKHWLTYDGLLFY